MRGGVCGSMFFVFFSYKILWCHLDDIQKALRRISFCFYSFFVILLSHFGLCRVPCDINWQDGVPVAEPLPLGFHHIFGNKEVGLQVLEYICGQLVEGYGDEVGNFGT